MNEELLGMLPPTIPVRRYGPLGCFSLSLSLSLSLSPSLPSSHGFFVDTGSPLGPIPEQI